MRSGATILILLALFAGCRSGDSDERVSFKGVSAIAEKDLRERIEPDLDRYARDPQQRHLDDAVYRIVYRYRAEGYALARASAHPADEKIRFRVIEGPRTYLGRVHFVGNTVFDDDELRRASPRGLLGQDLPYSIRLRETIKQEIVAIYESKGYIDVEVTPEEPEAPDADGRMSVRFAIKEGIQYVLKAVEGLPRELGLEPEMEQRKMLSRAYPPGRDEELEAMILEKYRENGWPYPRVKVRAKIDRETGEVVLQVEAVPGPRAELGGIEIAGREWTRAGFIRRRSGLTPGEKFRASDLRRAEDRLSSTRLFRSVRVAPGEVQEDTGRIPVQITVEERSMGEASLRGGYGSFEGARVGAEILFPDLLGGAEFLKLGGTVSRVGYRAEAETGIPYLMGTDLRPGVSAHYEDREFPSFDAVSYGAVFSVSYPLLQELTATVGWRYSIIRTDDVEPFVPPGDLLDFKYVARFLSLAVDLRDNALIPTQGIYARTDVSWSSTAFGSDLSFVSIDGQLSYYLPLPSGLVFAASLRGGEIRPVGATDLIPIALRYFAGGTTTVRGFEFESIGPKVGDDPTGGEVFLALQTEIRFPIWSDLHGAVFSDRGGVWFDYRDVDLDETRYSVGVGVRYHTPAGAIVADLGWNPRRRDGEEALEVHLSIGFPF